MERYYTVKQLSEVSGYKESYIRKLAEQHRIAYTRPNGGRLLFSSKDIARFLGNGRIPSVNEMAGL